MEAALAALVHIAVLRFFERRRAKCLSGQRMPFGLQALRLRRDAGSRKDEVVRLAHEHLAGIGPDIDQRLLHTGVAFRRSVTEADHEIAAPFEMVGHLLRRLLGDRGDARLAGAAKAFQREIVPCIEQKLTHQRPP